MIGLVLNVTSKYYGKTNSFQEGRRVISLRKMVFLKISFGVHTQFSWGFYMNSEVNSFFLVAIHFSFQNQQARFEFILFLGRQGDAYTIRFDCFVI